MLFFRENEKRLYELESLDFNALCNKTYSLNGSTVYWKHCTEEIIAHCALEGAVTDTFQFCRWQDGKLYIHGGDQDVFRLDGHDIDFVSNGTDGILFEDSEMEPVLLADSYQGSPIREHLVDGLNMQDPVYMDLYTAYIYSLFFEALLPTKPILLMHGVKGSGKTSALRALKRALFGQEADVSSGFTKSEGDALSAITHNYLLIADNVDGMVKWLGNLLASIATGTQILMRTLHRTNEMSKYTPRCFPAITSRDPLSLKRDDLADRLFMIILLRMKAFIPESELNRRIIADRNAMWRELLTNLNKIICLINDGGLPKSSSHRLADWARLVTVIGEALDLPGIEAGLDLLASARKEFVLEGNAIYEGIQAWTDNDKWRDENGNPREVTTGQLHSEIQNLYYNGHGFGVTKGVILQHQKYPIESARKFGVELSNTLAELASRFDITIREGRSRQKFVKIRPLPVEWTARVA
jgi:DNA polymerase III delta prime subunit